MKAPQRRKRGLTIPIGRHKDRFVEWVVLSDPEHISYLLNNRLPELDCLHDHIEWCMKRFDKRPFLPGSCDTDGCERPSHCVYYQPVRHFTLTFCEECVPEDGKYLPLYGYSDILRLPGAMPMRLPKGELTEIVKKIYRAKGLTGRKTEKAILSFFHD